MSNFLWVLVELGENISAFISWFFLIAFLFNLASSINQPDKSRVQLSFIMMISYFTSSLISLEKATYLDYLLFDIVTILIILMWRAKITYRPPTAMPYLIAGMSFNGSLMLGMHYDTVVLGNYDYWWFWAVYALGTLLVDMLMAAVLIINKDFLGFIRVAKKFKALFHSQKNSSALS